MAFDPLLSAAQYGYTNNIQLALQQKTSRLEMCAMLDSNLKGKAAQVIELFGTSGVQLDLPRNASVQVAENTSEQVWCRPRRINTDPHLLEKEDFIKRGTDYKFGYVAADAAAINRAKDAIMGTALWADRIVGEDATQTQAYSNPQGSVAIDYVPSGSATNSGLTVPKIVKGLELLEQAEVDAETEEVFLQVTSKQMTNLYNELTFINTQYREKAVLDEARKLVREILNVKIVRMPDAYVRKVSTTRRCMMFAKSGFVFGTFSGVDAQANPSPTHYNRVLLTTETWVGATRTEDAKFVPIDCLES